LKTATEVKPTLGTTELAAIESSFLRRQISPQVAAALLAKPRPKLTSQQGEIVDQLKKNCPGFAAMRTMALSFQGILQNGTVKTLHGWLEQATASGLHSLKQFARTLKQDLLAVEAAILQKWSNGPVEGHVNRLKTIKRQMYGRAGIDLLRARLVPIPQE
jgi:transposase